MALTKIDDRGLKTPVDLLDNEKIRFGTGNDLEIYHNGSYSYIDNTGTGDFYIRGNGVNTLNIRAKADEYSIECNPNGNVELYYDGSIKLYTTSTGAQVSGDLRFSDGEAAKWGNSQDLEIFHNNSWNYIDNKGSVNFVLRVKDTENAIVALPDGGVQLYYDGVQKLETTSTGGTVTGGADTVFLVEGTSTASRIDLKTSSHHRFIQTLESDGALRVYDQTNSAERMRIDSSGRLLLGTTTVGAAQLDTLTIHSDGHTGMTIRSGTDNNGHIGFADGTTGNARYRGFIKYEHGSSGTPIDKMTLATADAAALTLDSSQNATFAGNVTVSNTNPKIFLTDTNNTSDYSIRNDNGNLDFYDETNSASRLKIVSTGDATFTGGITAPRLTLSDDGATSPTFMLKTDDASPWGFIIKNDSYSTSTDIGLKAYQGNDGHFNLRLQGNAAYNEFRLTQHNGTTERSLVTFDTSSHATFGGTVSDSRGNVRTVHLNINSSAYTLVASDAGKAVTNSSGGWTVNNNIFTAGQVVTFINNSGSDQTITQGSGVTIYNTADATTGNRTLAGRGMATLIFYNASSGYISGAGLS